MFSKDRLRMQKIGGDHKAMKSSHSSSSIFQEKLFSPFLLLIFILVFLVVFHSNDYCYVSRTQVSNNTPSNQPISLTAKEGVLSKMSSDIEEDSGRKECDIFTGRWVRDYTPPLYEESECPYLYPQLTCLEHGRPNKDFRYWRWQPRHCSVASFNSASMLESLRGKRMMFVGDSLGRGQFTSMVCLLQMIIPQDAKSMETRGSLTIFTAKGYNATVEFYWAPFLLESNADDPLRHRQSDRLVRDGSIDGHGSHWREADILVFNSYKWWISGFRILRGTFEDEVKDIVAAPIQESYRMAIRTLIKWINYSIDPKKQRVFFTSMSPTHKRSELWGGVSDGNCYNETTIIEDQEFFGVDRSFMTTINDELGKSTVAITLINITGLSSARKDAHTSIYKQQWHPLTEEQLANPKSYADCVHWCLPGLQDTWNQLLFSKLLYP